MVVILIVLIIFGQGAPHFHPVLGLTNYIANPGREGKIEVGRGRGKNTGREREKKVKYKNPLP